MTHRRSLAGRLLGVMTAVVVAAALVPASASAASGQPYRYPVQPGTAQWAALANHKEMERVTQIPADVLHRLTTDQLVTTVLSYPLLLDAVLFNNVQQGMDVVISRSNGLQELLRRPDAGQALLRRYEQLDLRVPPSLSEAAIGERSWTAWKFEILLAQPQVLKSFSTAQLEKAMRVGRAQYDVKQTHLAAYGQASLDRTAVLLGRALATREGWDYNGSRLLREAFAPVAAADQVANAVDQHFSAPQLTHAISDGLGAQDYNTTVHTPNGSAVTVVATTYELSGADITYLNNQVAAQYPQASRQANASRRYNCHSFAWYWSSSSNTYWMNSPGDDKYWQDGSYTWWHPPMIIYPNMKWSWVYGDHSGNASGTSSYIHSKWGQGPWMYHYWDYSPYNDTDTDQYFR